MPPHNRYYEQIPIRSPFVLQPAQRDKGQPAINNCPQRRSLATCVAKKSELKLADGNVSECWIQTHAHSFNCEQRRLDKLCLFPLKSVCKRIIPPSLAVFPPLPVTKHVEKLWHTLFSPTHGHVANGALGSSLQIHAVNRVWMVSIGADSL